MGIRVVLNKEEDIVRPAKPEELVPKKPKGVFASFNKGTAKVMPEQLTLKQRIKNMLQWGGAYTPEYIAIMTGGKLESVKATLRDLRKDGMDVVLEQHYDQDGKFSTYRIAA